MKNIKSKIVREITVLAAKRGGLSGVLEAFNKDIEKFPSLGDFIKGVIDSTSNHEKFLLEILDDLEDLENKL